MVIQGFNATIQGINVQSTFEGRLILAAYDLSSSQNILLETALTMIQRYYMYAADTKNFDGVRCSPDTVVEAIERIVYDMTCPGLDSNVTHSAAISMLLVCSRKEFVRLVHREAYNITDEAAFSFYCELSESD